MKKKLKAIYVLLTSAVIALVNLPFAFAKSAASGRLSLSAAPDDPLKKSTDSLYFLPMMKSAYDSLLLNLKGMSREAFEYARKGFDKLVEQGRMLNDSIISIADFSQPSSEKRLYVLDLKNYRLLYNTYVAHGQNSGLQWATDFSNQGSSHKSSPGFYITRETYEGKHGLSLKLEGLEPGINDRAYQRGIVVHGAEYVNDALAQGRGYIGRSFGCPAVPVQACPSIINIIKGGTCFFIYHPSYINHSDVLN